MTVAHIQQLAIIVPNTNLRVKHTGTASMTTCFLAQRYLTTQTTAVTVYIHQMYEELVSLPFLQTFTLLVQDSLIQQL